MFPDAASLLESLDNRKDKYANKKPKEECGQIHGEAIWLESIECISMG